MLSYTDITTEISSGAVRPAYLLSGEEPFFIDRLSELFIQRIIPEAEQDFNLSLLYGSDRTVDISTITSEAMRFPMMGQRHLVLVREAQQVRDIEQIGALLPELPETSCLVIAYKGKVDKRKGLYKGFAALRAIYESSPISEREVPHFITTHLRERQIQVDARTALLMSEHTGNDLEKIMSEIEKLSIALGAQGGVLTPEIVEQYVGISREYNTFELLAALIQRDATKAFRIVYHFAANEKEYPIQRTIPILFNFFAGLMAVYYLPQQDERSIAQGLGVAPYIARDYSAGHRMYNAGQCFRIIRQIRTSDALSKGIDGSMSDGEILKTLVSFILTT